MVARRILIVEDDETTRERWVRVVAVHAELEIAAAEGTCREALLALRRDAPEVMLAVSRCPTATGSSRAALPRALRVAEVD